LGRAVDTQVYGQLIEHAHGGAPLSPAQVLELLDGRLIWARTSIGGEEFHETGSDEAGPIVISHANKFLITPPVVKSVKRSVNLSGDGPTDGDRTAAKCCTTFHVRQVPNF
jgi:hypothetical protein